jgi:hypothetical protein
MGTAAQPGGHPRPAGMLSNAFGMLSDAFRFFQMLSMLSAADPTPERNDKQKALPAALSKWQVRAELWRGQLPKPAGG